MTQEELANKSNISKLQAYWIESGISILQLKTLVAFAYVLEMELWELFRILYIALAFIKQPVEFNLNAWRNFRTIS